MLVPAFQASSDRQTLDVGANLFVGNLDPDVDEKMLYDTFLSFGTMTQTPKVGRDLETGASKGYAFISYDCFEASDAAIEAMNGQYMLNRPITVSYAYKKDTKGERHGSAAERLLAAQNRKTQPMVPAHAYPAALPAAPMQPPMGVPPGMPAVAPGMMPVMPIATAGMMPYYGAAAPGYQYPPMMPPR